MRFILLNLVTKETDPESSGLTKATRQSTVGHLRRSGSDLTLCGLRSVVKLSLSPRGAAHLWK